MQKYINNSRIPISLAVFLATDWYDHDDTPNTYSTTTLLKPLRQLVLAPRVTQELNVIDIATQKENRMGTALHSAIEAAWTHNYRQALLDLGYTAKQVACIRINPTDEQLAKDPTIQPVYLEQRYKRKILVDEIEYIITGAIDFIAGGGITDFKNTQTYAYGLDSKKEGFAAQGSIYRWLDPVKVTKDYIEIVWVFKDWKPWLAKKGSDYPPSDIHPVKYTLADVEDTERFIIKKLRDLALYKDAPEEQIPHCSDKELWRSPYTYKYYRDPEKVHAPNSRSTANYPDDESGANMHLMRDGHVGVVVKTGGEVKACKYCPAFHACTQKDIYLADGSLTLK